MGMGLLISSLGRSFLLFFSLVWVTEALDQAKYFNVRNYGAVEGGEADNSKVVICAVWLAISYLYSMTLG